MSALFNKTDLDNCLASFKGARVGIVGDVMLDCYIYGSVDRISAEAPVPIVNVTNEHLALGGAANVANNVISLGGEASFISVTGDDATAQQIERLLETNSIRHSLIRDTSRPSSLKTRIIGQNQQIVRFDKEQTTPLSSEMRTTLLKNFEELLDSCDCIIFSDYAKGIFGIELMDSIRSLIASKRKNTRLLVDPKPINMGLFSTAFLLTPNAKEAGQAVGLETPRSKEDIIQTGKAMLQAYPCENLLITLGSQGMALFCRTGGVWHIPTMAQNVYDVTGAGDTVVATIGIGLASGCSLLASCVLANYAAGLVIGKLGTASVAPEEMHAALHHSPLPVISNWSTQG